MKRLITGILFISLMVSVSCSGPQTALPIYETTTSPFPTSTPVQEPGYNSVTFTLEAKGEYMFPIYLKSDQTLYLTWFVKEGEMVWFHIFTPSNVNLGFYEYGEYADGTLSRDSCQGFTEGRTVFSPSEYGWGEGYYEMFITSYTTIPSVVEVNYWIDDKTPQEPLETTTQPPMTTTIAATFDMTPSQIVGSYLYDGQQVEVSGQVFSPESGKRLIVDGKTGINLTGNIAGLFDGIYKFKGYYDTDTNTLDVSRVMEENVFPTTVDFGKTQEADLVPVEVRELAATPPKEISNTITSYLSIPYLSDNLPIYPYVVFTEEGLYLALSDTEVELPTKFSFYSEGEDYSFTFSASEVTGTLLKTPLELVDLGAEWIPDEFQGIIIADTIMPFNPIDATVKEINANPDYFIFKRVSIQGSYLVTTAAIDYSDMQAPIGQGILADDFSDFFDDDTDATLETIDPEATVWQLRECWIMGTVIYPTEEILRYLDYSQPLSPAEIAAARKPALIVDTLLDDMEQVADISQLNPITGNPSIYWGKVVEFEGYALGMKYPMKSVAEAVSSSEVPVNVNLVAIGIADKSSIDSQLVIIGLDNELIDEQGEVIVGKYRFRVAVTQIPEQLVSGFPYTDTVFFLLSKEELPI